MTTFAQGLGFPEAPVPLPDGGLLCVEMTAETGCVTRLGADGRTRQVIARTGRPNGLAMDRHGAIWVAETAMRAVLKMTLAGEYEIFATAAGGKPFLFLNDLAFAPDGSLFVTDSGILLDELAPGGELNPAYRSLPYDGSVYRLDLHTGNVTVIDRGIQFTNGIAFGPDGALYIAETLSGDIFRYEWRGGGQLGPRATYGNVIERYDAAVLQGPDGIKFGADGNLYCAVFGQGDISVLGTNGRIVRRIKVDGTHPTNLAFLNGGTQQIYVTEMSTGTVQRLDVGTDGLALHR